MRSFESSRFFNSSNSEIFPNFLTPPQFSISLSGKYIISPMIAYNSEVLPLPTSPITQTNSPLLIEMSIFFKGIKSSRGFSTPSFTSVDLPSLLSLLSCFLYASSLLISSASFFSTKPHEKEPFTLSASPDNDVCTLMSF